MNKGRIRYFARVVGFSLLSQHACRRSCRCTTACRVCSSKFLIPYITKWTCTRCLYVEYCRTVGESWVRALLNDAVSKGKPSREERYRGLEAAVKTEVEVAREET